MVCLANAGGFVTHGLSGVVGDGLSIHIMPTTAGRRVRDGRHMGPTTRRHSVPHVEPVLAADQPQTVARMGVEQETIAAARSDLVHNPGAAGRQLLRFEPCLDRESLCEVP